METLKTSGKPNSKFSYKKYFQTIRGLFHANTQPMVFLPEKIRYKLLYNKGFISSIDINTLFNSKFDMIPLFLVAKYLDSNEKIKLLIETFESEDYFNWLNYEKYLSNINSDIDAHKLHYLSLIGFETTSQFEKKIMLLDPNNMLLPVVVLHGGLLGMKAIVEKYNKIIFRDEKNNEGRLSHKTDQGIKTSPLNRFSSTQKYIIIDDTLQTGNTINQIAEKIQSDGGESICCVPFIIPTGI